MSRSRYGSDIDEMEAARQRHAAREAQEWAEDRRETDRQWRESEARRSREHWENLRREGSVRADSWRFDPLHSESGKVVGWEAYVNGRRVGMLVHTPRGMAVIATGDSGEALVGYMQGGKAPGAEEIMDAYQRSLEAGR